MTVQYRKTLTVSAASANAVATSQTPAGAGNLTLTSATVTLPNGGQRPSVTSAGADISNRTFTFTGTDRAGNPMSMSMTGPGAGLRVILPATMATITNVAISGVAAGAITVGYAAQADLNPLPLDTRSTPTNISLTLQGFTGAGTPAATVRFTQSVVQDVVGLSGSRSTYNLGTVVWFNHATLVAQTAAATGNFDKPVAATSVFLDGNDQAASVDFIVLQGTSGIS